MVTTCISAADSASATAAAYAHVFKTYLRNYTHSPFPYNPLRNNTSTHGPLIELIVKVWSNRKSFFLATLLMLVAFYYAQKELAHIEDEEDIAATYKTDFKFAWAYVHRFPALMRMIENYYSEKTPWGPWDARASSFSKTQPAACRPTKRATCPLSTAENPCYRSGCKARGARPFDFIVLFPDGAREKKSKNRKQDKRRVEFMHRLFSHREHLVSFWTYGYGERRHVRRGTPEEKAWSHNYAHLFPHPSPEPQISFREAGASSWWKRLLPIQGEVMVAGKTEESWKEDLALKVYMDKPWIDVLLLVHAECAVVHVEALDFKPVALDEVMLKHLQDARAQDEWSEAQMSEDLDPLYTQLRLDWKNESGA